MERGDVLDVGAGQEARGGQVGGMSDRLLV
jgi:hypothetical protein